MKAVHRRRLRSLAAPLQSYGDGWKSGAFLPQERQFFGLPGGLMNDWHLMTNVEGLFAAGRCPFRFELLRPRVRHRPLRRASRRRLRRTVGEVSLHEPQVDAEAGPAYQALGARQRGHLARAQLRHYPGHAAPLRRVQDRRVVGPGAAALAGIEARSVPGSMARNPHDLIRVLGGLSILTTAQIVLHSCLARKASSHPLHFSRLDYPELDPPEWRKFVTVRAARRGSSSIRGRSTTMAI